MRVERSWNNVSILLRTNAKSRFNNELRNRDESHPMQAQLTPSYILEPVRQLLGGISLDPCTEPNNPTHAEMFYALPTDGCTASWDTADTVWCNPPYGSVRNRWVEKCIVEGRKRKVVLLIPSHTETLATQNALKNCTSALFIRARLKFGLVRDNGQEYAASHGSVLFGFGVDLSPLDAFGIVVQPSK